jgi:hypothetical protein
MIIIFLLQGISVWISELSIISFFVFASAGGIVVLTRFKKLSYFISYLVTLVITVLFVFMFISYAKSHATVVPAFSNNIFASPSAIVASITLVKDRLLFNILEADVFIRCSTVFLIVLFCVVSIIIFKRKFYIISMETALLNICVVTAVLSLAVILTSNWVSVNYMYPRYFIIPFYLFMLSCFLVLDKSSNNLFLLTFFCVTIVFSSLSGAYAESGKPSQMASLYPLKKLGKVGVVADYWNSYMVSSIDPDQIVATPCNQSWSERKPMLVQKVFERKLFLIGNNWFESFPDSLVESARHLIKNGEEFNIGEFRLCQYQVKGVK